MRTPRLAFVLASVCSAAAAVAYAQDFPNPGEPVGIVRSPAQWPGSERVIWDACGGEGERACLPSDPSYKLLPERAAGARCDRALVPMVPLPARPGVSFVCTDLGDRSKAAVRARLDPKLKSRQEDQYGRIAADLPINLVPTLGTHNSYSNAVDGSESGMSKDQEHSITDQLWLGARHVRLDPMGDGFRQLLCHMSPGTAQTGLISALRSVNGNVPDTDVGLCFITIGGITPGVMHGRISYARPFYLALREIHKWLERNPGEVISLTVNNFWDPSTPAYIDPNELEAAIEHELRDVAYPRPNDSPTMWPTIRQIRAAGKQILITSANRGRSVFVWPLALTSSGSLFSFNTSQTGFSECKPRGRKTGIVEYDPLLNMLANNHLSPDHIGEDRSLSVLWDPASSDGLGLITPADMDTAVFCGFNHIGLDFFYSLNKAPVISGFKTLDFRGGQKDDCTTCDDRPQRMIWSWQHDSQPRPGVPATLRALMPVINDQTPATIADAQFYRWTQESESTSFPYACASLKDDSKPFPDLDNPWAYAWTVTTVRGPWKYVEKACQELGANYHFWRPMSSPENRRLIDAMKASLVPQVWLNHLPGKIAALAGKPDTVFSLAEDFSENVIITSGSGGKITARYAGNNNLPQLVTVTAAREGSNMFVIRKASNLGVLRPGRYVATIRFTETRPDGSGEDAYDVNVTMDTPVAMK